MADEQAQGGGGATTLQEGGSLLDQILAEAKVTPADRDSYAIAKQGVSAFIAEVLTSSDKFRRIDKAAVDVMIAELDARMSAQINEILHHPKFQQLESAWRGLKYLID